MDESEWLSDHQWKFEDDAWTCQKCGHSFPWKDSKKRVPQKFASDGSPARGDPCWFGFHIAGLMSFIDACSQFSKQQQEWLVDISGEQHAWGGDNRVGTHAVAFKHCMFEQQAENLIAVAGVMEE